MNRQQLMRGLIVASFGALAMTAGAQTQQPQGDNPRGNSTPGNTGPTAGQPGGTPSGMGTMNNGTMNNGTTTNGMMRDKGTSQMYDDYKSARRSCDGMPTAQQESCNNAANKKFSSIDAKCQKVSGPALDDCIRGADHGK